VAFCGYCLVSVSVGKDIVRSKRSADSLYDNIYSAIAEFSGNRGAKGVNSNAKLLEAINTGGSSGQVEQVRPIRQAAFNNFGAGQVPRQGKTQREERLRRCRRQGRRRRRRRRQKRSLLQRLFFPMVLGQRPLKLPPRTKPATVLSQRRSGGDETSMTTTAKPTPIFRDVYNPANPFLRQGQPEVTLQVTSGALVTTISPPFTPSQTRMTHPAIPVSMAAATNSAPVPPTAKLPSSGLSLLVNLHLPANLPTNLYLHLN